MSLEPSFVADNGLAGCALHDICQDCNKLSEEVADPYNTCQNDNFHYNVCESGVIYVIMTLCV